LPRTRSTLYAAADEARHDVDGDGTMRICAGGVLSRGDEILLAKRSASRTF
jgi:hypothetical protein